MATKSNNEKKFVQCITCKHGEFMQWFQNPVIAYCHLREEKMVATSRRLCPLYSPSGQQEPEIKHFDHYEF